jgi:hypothetical protein
VPAYTVRVSLNVLFRDIMDGDSDDSKKLRRSDPVYIDFLAGKRKKRDFRMLMIITGCLSIGFSSLFTNISIWTQKIPPITKRMPASLKKAL